MTTAGRYAVALMAAFIGAAAVAEPLQIVVPRATQPPTLDGVLAPGEWEDAAALTGLIDQFDQVAHPRQAVFWLTYDASNMYVACRSKCYPEERTTAAPQLWLDRDSSVVVGLDPARKGRGDTPSHFLLRANVNKQTLAKEIFWTLAGVKITYPHPDWASGVVIGQKIEGDVWTCEMSLPLVNMNAADLKDGETWGLLLGRDYAAADPCALTLSSDWRFGDGLRHYGRAFYNNYRLEKEYGRMTLGGQAPVVQVMNLGNFTEGQVAPSVSVKNTSTAPIKVTVRMELRVAYGSGNQDKPQEWVFDLPPGARQEHVFQAVSAPPGEKHTLILSAAEAAGRVLYRQEIPFQPGYGKDRATAAPDVYFSGYHFGSPKANQALLPTCYDPITNRVYCRTRPAPLADGHRMARGEVTVRRAGERTPLATLPLAGPPSEYMVRFHDLSYWRAKPAAVLEWVCPADGKVDIAMDGSHQYGPVPGVDGEAIQILHFEAAAKTNHVLVPRTVTDKCWVWVPLVASNVTVKAGDKIHFYYDRNRGEGCDNFCLRGTLTLTAADGTRTVYNPGGEFTADKQGGTTGVWFYRWDDKDATPNPDGVYPELPLQHIPHTQQNAWVALDPAYPDHYAALMAREVRGSEWIVDAPLPVLAPGVYEATAAFYTSDGALMARSRQLFVRFDHAKDLPWLGNQIGITTNVLPPWTPVSGEKSRVTGADGKRGKGYTLRCWGREYTVDGSGLFAGIRAKDADLLASPVRIELLDAASNAVPLKSGALKDVRIAANEARWNGELSGGGWKVSTAARMEYDGYVEVRLRVEPPRGVARTAACIRLVAPFAPGRATHLHAAGGEWFRSSVASIALSPTNTGVLWHSGQRYGGGIKPYAEDFGKNVMTVGSFRPYIWVGDAQRGLAFMGDNDQGWVPDDTRVVPAQNVVRGPEGVALVLNLVARPFAFTGPREVKFSLQATPVKPLPADFRERASRLAMITAFPGGFPETGWSWDGQMYAIADRLPNLVGTNSVVRTWLFGLPGSCPYPLNWDLNIKRKTGMKAFHGYDWIFTPYQSLLNVMTFPEVDDPRMPPGKQVGDVYGYIYAHMSQGHMEHGNPSIADVDIEYRLWCYRNWIHHVGLEGMYFDQTEPVLASNPRAGFGYTLDLPDRPALNGRLQPGYRVTGMRQMFKRLHALFVEEGHFPTHIYLHTTDADMVSAYAFADYFLEGENEPRITKDYPWISEKIPPERMQAMHNGAGKWGMGMTQLEMIESSAWTPIIWRDLSGWLWLHECEGSHHNAMPQAGLDLKRPAEFLPYWDATVAAALTTGDPQVFASAWRQDTNLIVLVFNRTGEERAEQSIGVDPKALGLKGTADRWVVRDLEDQKPDLTLIGGPLAHEVKDGRLTVRTPLKPRNYRLFMVTHP